MSNIRVKSEFSFLKGFGTVSEYIAKAKENGDDTIFLTDDGLFGAHDFLEEASKNGLKGVIGCEIPLSDNGEIGKIVLYARNLDGYRELSSLITKSFEKKTSDYSGYIEHSDLQNVSNNIIALIPFESSSLSKDLLKKNSSFRNRIRFLKEVFKDNLFIEKQDNKKLLEFQLNETIGEQDFNLINSYIDKIATSLSIKTINNTPSFYSSQKDSEAYEVFRGVGQGKTLADEKRKSYNGLDLSLRSSAGNQELKEFSNLFSSYTLKKINSLPFVSLNDYEEGLHKKYESTYKAMDSQEFLMRYKAFKGIFARRDVEISEDNLLKLVSKIDTKKLDLKNNKYSPEEITNISLTNGKNRQLFIDSLSPSVKKDVEQLDYELLVVDGMGFNGYFLIVEDYINFCKDRGYPVGPGRGSAAGALIAYSLGITDIDPIKYQLLFSRFLNVGRVSMPDIDSDFDPRYRDVVIEYVKNRYGKENVSEVATFGTFAAKSAIKDTGKYYGENYQVMNRFAKNLPGTPGITIKDMLENSKFLKESYSGNAKTKKIIDTARSLEKRKKQLGVHACAVIISPENLNNFTPVMLSPSGKRTTQFESHALEDLGLLKMDFLGLENLSVIDETIVTARDLGYEMTEKKNKLGLIDLNSLNYDDHETYKNVFAKGDTIGVFQFESLGMRKYLKEMRADSFDDIIAMVALYRPGPMAFIPSYIQRKLGKEEIRYLNPDLEGIMKNTYGICIFQEQIILMSQKYAGFSESEADLLRRAIGKKKKDIIEQQKSVFINKAVGQGRDAAEARSIFEEVIEPAGNYSFNKSHAVCYAAISFQTAYLKNKYPLPFYKSLLNSKIGGSGDILEEIGKIWEEAGKLGIKIENPDINSSSAKFEVINESHSIRFGLKSIKSMPEKDVDAIIEERNANGPFKSLRDMIDRMPKEKLSLKSIEVLACSGALDSFEDRYDVINSIPLIKAYRENKKKVGENQASLFSMMDTSESETFADFQLKKDKATKEIDKILFEKAYIGYSYQPNPLLTISKVFANYGADIKSIDKIIKTNEAFDKSDDKSPIKLIGFIDSRDEFISKKGNKVVELKCLGNDYTFKIRIDHSLIHDDQILVGNVITLEDKKVKKDEEGLYSVSNPFVFETSTFDNFLGKAINSGIKLKNPKNLI